MDRHGVVGPHHNVGRRQASAGAERNAQNRTHFLHNIQQDGCPGFLQNTGAVPDKAEETEIQFQAVLPKQVHLIPAEEIKGNIQAVYSCLLSSCPST